MSRPLTDFGNAERFAAQHGADVRYVTTWKSWLIWEGARWQRDETHHLERKAKDTVRAIYREALEAETVEERSAIAKHAVASESSGRVRAMLDLARAEDGVAIPYGEFDAHPYLLTVDNGTLDLRTGQLRPHERTDLLTKLAPVRYDRDAPCVRWERFLARIFDNDSLLIAYIQRAVGYSLTGDTREQCLHLLHGVGSNGKSTFLEVLALVLGDYGVQADFATFLDKKTDGPRNDVARLAGARMVRSSEVGEGKSFNESLVKALTGTDTIAARYLYSEAFEFKPEFKLWFAANHKPVIRGTDHAIWRRVRLVPFTVTIPAEERDSTLSAKLADERSGILTWAVAGCLMWQRDGLQPPPVVLAATAEYRSESDVIGAFLDDCCETGPGLEVPASEMYTAYARWVEENGQFKLSHTAFGRRLEERGHGVRKNGTKFRQGLRLLPHAGSKSAPQSWDRGWSGER